MTFDQFHLSAAETIYATCRVLTGALAAATLVALFALGFFEVSKGPIRQRDQLVRFGRWLKQMMPRNPDEPPPAWVRQVLENADASLRDRWKNLRDRWKKDRHAKLDPWENVRDIGICSNELFMREVQIAAQTAIEHPERYFSAFLRLASFANSDEIDTIIFAEALRDEDPELFAMLLQDGETDGATAGRASVAIAAAQDSIARSLERNLDNLQLGLAARWKSQSRAIYVAFSLVVAIVAPSLDVGLKVFSPITLVVACGIGLLGGIMAATLSAVGSMILARSPS